MRMAQASLCRHLVPPCVITDSLERAEIDLFSPTRKNFELELRVDMVGLEGSVGPQG
jgi:hypothetical protein